MKNGYLTLRKCAYIFDYSNNVYFHGTHEQYLQKCAKNKRNEKIPYTLTESGDPVILIANIEHRLNALQIASIDDLDNVINYRRDIKTEDVARETKHFHIFCNNSLYSNKFRSLRFEFYTGLSDLGYIRVHFKNNSVRFIIDDRSGTIYTSGEHGQHKATTANILADYLDLGSKAARAEFFEIINIITKGGK